MTLEHLQLKWVIDLCQKRLKFNYDKLRKHACVIVYPGWHSLTNIASNQNSKILHRISSFKLKLLCIPAVICH